LLYFGAKKDLKFLKQFTKDAIEMIDIEAKVQMGNYTMISPSELREIRRDKAAEKEGYLELRERVAENVIHTIRLAQRMGIPIDLHSYPAPAVGGPVVPINLFQAILNDTSYGGVEKQYIIDALKQTIGQYDRLVQKQFWQIVNPFFWLKEAILLVVRLPYTILLLSGFDIAKIEQELWAKLLSLAWIVAAISILIRYGFDQQQILSVILERGGK
jgi:hypothetical protein